MSEKILDIFVGHDDNEIKIIEGCIFTLFEECPCHRKGRMFDKYRKAETEGPKVAKR